MPSSENLGEFGKAYLEWAKGASNKRDNKVLGNAFLKEISIRDAFTQTQLQKFLSNIKKIKAKAQTLGQKLVLLQAPNKHSVSVKTAGQALGIPVIENIGLFDKGISINGRNAYFRDKVCYSGHMTELGIDIFTAHLAEKLLPLLPSPR